MSQQLLELKEKGRLPVPEPRLKDASFHMQGNLYLWSSAREIVRECGGIGLVRAVIHKLMHCHEFKGIVFHTRRSEDGWEATIWGESVSVEGRGKEDAIKEMKIEIATMDEDDIASIRNNQEAMIHAGDHA